MRLTIKRKNIRSFASLSALGAGAMALTAGSAKASSIVYVDVNAKVGFNAGFSSGFALSIDGAPLFRLKTRALNTNSGHVYQVNLTAVAYCGAVNCRIAGLIASSAGVKLARAFSAGQQWSGVPPIPAAAVIAGRHFAETFTVGNHATFTTKFDSTDRYFLFRFLDNGTTSYGWGQVSVAGDKLTNPDVTLIDYAYDTSGAFLPAGDTGSSAPEPSPAIPLALSALVLGAPAIRRCRAAKTT